MPKLPRKKTARKKTVEPMTTAQRLGSIIKSARQIMRKDKGLNGDLDRLPPNELVESILAKERDILRLMEEIQTEVRALV